MVELNMEHVLILVIAVFLLYHLMNRCSCSNNFSVGGQEFNLNITPEMRQQVLRRRCTDFLQKIGGFDGIYYYLEEVQAGREDNSTNDRIKECVNYKDGEWQFLGDVRADTFEYDYTGAQATATDRKVDHSPQYSIFISNLKEICDIIDCSKNN